MHTFTKTSTLLALLMLWTLPPDVSWSHPPQEGAPPAPLGTPEVARPARHTPYPLFALTPTGSLGITLNLVDPKQDKPIFSGHLGANLYPMLQVAPLFVSALLRMEYNTELEGNPVDFLPTARLGFAWLPGNPSLDYLHILLPYAQVYGTLSYRVPRAYRTDLGRNLERAGAWRAMLGVSAPMFGTASAFMCAQGVPLPNTLELGVQRDADREQTDILLMISIAI